MDGTYIAFYNQEDDRWQILREVKGENKVYEVVIRDAGYKREFALELVSLLNSKGSQVGESVGSTETH